MTFTIIQFDQTVEQIVYYLCTAKKKLMQLSIIEVQDNSEKHKPLKH